MIVLVVFIGVVFCANIQKIVDLPVEVRVVRGGGDAQAAREACIQQLFANGVLPKCTAMEYNNGCSYTLTADCDARDYCELVAGLKQEKCLFSVGFVEATNRCLASYDDECLAQLTDSKAQSLVQRFTTLVTSFLSAEAKLFDSGNRLHKRK